MNSESTVLNVSLALSRTNRIPVGRLALDNNVAVFEYDPSFASSGLSLNPAFGAANAGLIRPRDASVAEGLHGVFSDSLPDAWGRRLLESRLLRDGTAVLFLSVLDRLAYVGDAGRGALVYEPAVDGADAAYGDVDLETLAVGAARVLEGDEVSVLGELQRLGGTCGGSRPKVNVALDGSGRARSETGAALPSEFASWIVKFRAPGDLVDGGPLEAAYAETARIAGIDVPHTRLLTNGSGPGFFATQRFDRGPEGRRHHMISVAGMLETAWSAPTIDYERLLSTVRYVTRDDASVRQMFRRMVFNVLAHNRDDHTKQHSFILAEDGRWRLAPAYDLTLSYGPDEQRYLPVNGRKIGIGRADMLAVADEQSINASAAAAILDEVTTAIEGLPALAREYGVSQRTGIEVKRVTEHQLHLAAVG